jgi:hypothetical protein
MGLLNWINDKAAAALDATVGRPQFLKDAPRPEEAVVMAKDTVVEAAAVVKETTVEAAVAVKETTVVAAKVVAEKAETGYDIARATVSSSYEGRRESQKATGMSIEQRQAAMDQSQRIGDTAVIVKKGADVTVKTLDTTRQVIEEVPVIGATAKVAGGLTLAVASKAMGVNQDGPGGVKMNDIGNLTTGAIEGDGAKMRLIRQTRV